MKQKSLKLNMVLNAIRGLLKVVFPLITFPYISRVLGVDNLGKYNFANSIISYFILFAGLGISSYAIREGSYFRNETNRLKVFADEMFTINMISTVTAYLCLICVIVIVPKFWDYKILLIIFSLQIVFCTIGIEWIYSIYEEYVYITVRSILFQLISLILLFVFVRTENDVNIYAAITVFSSGGANVLNYIHARKYCKVGLTRIIDWRKHIKPIMVLFAMSVTVTIYVSSDTTILGFLCSDYEVGIYSVSVKIYNIIKNIVASIIIASIPRMSAILGLGDEKKFISVGLDIYNTLLTIMLPVMVGIIVLREEIVLIVSGEAYLDAVPSLSILSIAMILCLGAYFWGQAVLVPVKKEKVVLIATVISAVVNIVINFVLIPIWKENAAAFTTLLAEGIAFLICRHEGVKIIKPKGIVKNILKILSGCVGIVFTSLLFMPFKGDLIVYTLLVMIISGIVYLVIEILLKNEAVTSIMKKSIKNR